MNELEHIVYVVNPVSGEQFTLAAPDQDLASYLSDIRDLESRIKEEKALVNRELLARLDKQRKWTLHLDNGLKLSAPSDEPSEEWDGEGLYVALSELVDADLIGVAALNAAVEVETVFKVKRAGVNALRKNARLAETVNRFSTPAERQRYVRVSRS